MPVNTRLTPSLYTYMLNDSRAKILIIHEDLLDLIEKEKEKHKFLKHKIVVGKNFIPQVAQVILKE